jgi:hypothetical protein
MRTALAVAAGLVAASLVPSPADAALETTVGLGLARGPAVTVPHVEQQTVVDGDLRIPVDADYLWYVGKSGSSYVVEAGDQTDGRSRIVRVAPDGTVTRLARAFGYPSHLSDDGQQLVTTRTRRDSTSTITVRSATTGARIAQRTFRGHVLALDVADDRVLLGGKRTILWRTDVDTHDVLSGDTGYDGDLSADVVAGFDPSTDTAEGACTRIMRVSTGKVVTTMCDDLVLEFNADATLMATTGRYMDGPISVIRARTLDGRVLARYRSSRPTTINDFRWETPTALLVGVLGEHRSGTARCTGTQCELAGRPLPYP